MEADGLYGGRLGGGYGWPPGSGADSGFQPRGSANASDQPCMIECGPPLPPLPPQGVHSRDDVIWCQAIAGSGGSQGFPAMALLMASIAVMPWAAAVSR